MTKKEHRLKTVSSIFLIYFACPFVCLYPINAQRGNFCGNSLDPREKIYWKFFLCFNLFFEIHQCYQKNPQIIFQNLRKGLLKATVKPKIIFKIKIFIWRIFLCCLCLSSHSLHKNWLIFWVEKKEYFFIFAISIFYYSYSIKRVKC